VPPLATVSGALDPALVRGATSAGDHLIGALPATPGERATDVYFFEAPLTLERLGDAMLGRANREDATLTPDTAAAELEDFAEAGGVLAVELTPLAAGADLAALAGVEAASGVRIVASAHAGEGPLALRLGPGRAGVIVLGPAAEPAAREEALGLAARGVPVMLDAAWLGGAETSPGPVAGAGDPVHDASAAAGGAGRGAGAAAVAPAPLGALHELLDTAEAAGVPADRLAVLGARSLAHRPDALSELAARGVYLHFGSLGRIPSVYTEVSDHDVAVSLAALTEAGHGERLLLAAGLDRRHALRAHGGHGLGFLPRQFLPYLGFMGIGADAAGVLASDNLVRFLDWSRP
jgi:phosphotriesterase-related protein